MPTQQPGFQLSFQPVISASCQYGSTDYANDQTWEILPADHHPLGLCCKTTYGLRARSVEIIPVILDANNLPFRDTPPAFILTHQLPNLVRYQVKLFPDIDVALTLAVPNSHTLTGHISLQTLSSREKRLRVGVLMRLVPIQPGQQMSVQEQDGKNILVGKTEELYPVCIVAGMPKVINRPQPGLIIENIVATNQPVNVRWAVSAGASKRQSIEEARQTVEAVQAPTFMRQIREFDNHGLHIHTGNDNWNELFHLTRVHSQRLVHSPTDVMPFAHPIDARQPDDGYSMRGDGSDFDPEQQGITALEVYHGIRNYYLPERPDLALGIFSNFIQKQQGFGNIDVRYGLGGYQAHLLATPIMAATLAEIQKCHPQPSIIAESYNLLRHFIDRWIDLDHDRDADLLPEWDHAVQTGWEENPLFDRWQTSGKGYPPEIIEAPDLAGYLFHECKSMATLAELIGRAEDRQQYTSLAERIHSQAQIFWDKRKKQFCYRDRDSHTTPDGSVLFSGEGSGTYHLENSFAAPTRVCLKIKQAPAVPAPLEIQIVGKNAKGVQDLQKVSSSAANWKAEGIIIACMDAFSALEQITIWNLPADIQWTLEQLKLTQSDITQFIPLWAGMLDEKQAGDLVRKTLLPNWANPFPYGVPLVLKPDKPARSREPKFPMHPMFMSMLIDGLINYGYYSEAAQLVNKLMEAIINVIQSTSGFAGTLDAKTGLAAGARNPFSSMPPTGLFLRSLGLEINSPDRITISGVNPYPWDVDIHFRGTRILRGTREAEIVFRDGQTIRVAGPEKRMISWKGDGEKT